MATSGEEAVGERRQDPINVVWAIPCRAWPQLLFGCMASDLWNNEARATQDTKGSDKHQRVGGESYRFQTDLGWILALPLTSFVAFSLLPRL